ncbi:MAG: serine hydrolase domain-containing protein [Longimicrobiales bacterium]|nr:serine hydrolase domain-containing protein [Longimicrobiales bacterium]
MAFRTAGRPRLPVRVRAALRWLLIGLAGTGAVALVAWLTFPVWSGFGAWTALPAGPAPAHQVLLDPRFAQAGDSALALLAAHRREHGFPALTGAVSVDGSVVWVGATGWADLESGTPAGPETVFRIGSTSKAVTATALARLLDRGRIALDTPLARFRGDWPNARWGKLTPRQLGSHTAGLPGYEDNRDAGGLFMTVCGCRRYDTVWESLRLFDGARLRYEPGTDFHYSSFDVNLLGALLAEVEGRPFLEVLDSLVFDPLGLAQAGAENDGRDGSRLATFYESEGGRARAWRPFDLSQRLPGGGLVATSRELARLGGAWLDTTFIALATREALWTPQRLASGEVNPQRYAIGWRFYAAVERPGHPGDTISYAHHGGVSKGAMSWLVVYPESRVAVAVNLNTRAETFPTFAAVERRISALFLDRAEALSAAESPVEPPHTPSAPRTPAR